MKLRPDLQIIADLVPDNSKVLDLGCGDGTLLEYLVRQKNAHGRGIELSEEGIIACIRRGLSVRQGILQEGLADYPDLSFDFVILSQTLPYVSNSTGILQEMLRVGRQAIVSFPNWGYWKCRLSLLLTGRIPQAPDLPYPWYHTPRWQAFTIKDFADLCRQIDIHIAGQFYLDGNHPIHSGKFKNLRSTTAVFVLEKWIAK